MKCITIATVTSLNSYYNMMEEKTIFFHRKKWLTYRGIQRMLDNGCPETDYEPKPCYSVTRLQKFTSA